MEQGGSQIRRLREERHYTKDGKHRRLSMEVLADKAGLDYRAVFDIEHGKTRRPSWDTLVRLLDALNEFLPVSPDDRAGVFSCYGYRSAPPKPTDGECQAAALEWQREYQHIKLPMYLVDFTQRLIAWNEFAPRILGMTSDQAEIQQFKDITTFDLAFGARYIAASRIVNGDEFLPLLIRTIKAEMQEFRNEAWYIELIQDASERYPLFKELWNAAPDVQPPVSVRQHGPIAIRHSDGAILKFQLLGIDFVNDPRFRVVQYHPVDEPTMQAWNAWIQEEQQTSRA